MNQDTTYSVMIFWSDDDAAFIATVPDLPGCMAHGETRALAIKQIEIAIQNWLDTARDIGREIPSPPKDMAAYIKELDRKAQQTIEIGIKNAMPSILDALAKEMAKTGEDVWFSWSRTHGIRWMIRENQKETVDQK
jgi:predicted RNase H-like HicB family nuclease